MADKRAICSSCQLFTENLDITAILVSDDDTTSQFRTITVRPNDPSMGTVIGGGTFYLGATTTLAAIPNASYRFVQWQDANSENPRTITVTADAEYIAYFAGEIGIDDVSQMEPTVSAELNIIHVHGAAGLSVRIFDVTGRQLLFIPCVETNVCGFRVPATGVYLVQVGDSPAQRVVVR